MIETMYEAPGSGLAANQVGVQRRVFVYDVGDGPGVVINPQIVESAGEWTYEEGCLSVPGLSWPIVRPDRVHLVGIDLEGNELSIEAEMLGPGVPARARPPGRRAPGRAPRRRAAPGGAPDPAGPGARPAVGRDRRSPEPLGQGHLIPPSGPRSAGATRR